MDIPGLACSHRIITDECREAKGDDACVNEVVESVINAVSMAIHGWEPGSGAKVHVVVTVERPTE